MKDFSIAAPEFGPIYLNHCTNNSASVGAASLRITSLALSPHPDYHATII